MNFLADPARVISDKPNMRYDLYGQPTAGQAYTTSIIPTRPTDNNVTSGAMVPPYVHCVDYASVPKEVSNEKYLAETDYSKQNSGNYSDMFTKFSQNQPTGNAFTTDTPSNILPPLSDYNITNVQPNAGFSQITNAPVPQTVKVVGTCQRNF